MFLVLGQSEGKRNNIRRRKRDRQETNFLKAKRRLKTPAEYELSREKKLQDTERVTAKGCVLRTAQQRTQKWQWE